MAIPARYREYLREVSGGRVAITLGVDECLLIYPLAEWRNVQQTLVGLPNTDPRAQALKRLLIGHAEENDLDGQGRVLVSATLRKLANLGKRVSLVGLGNKFELWDETRWEGQRDDMVGLARDATLEVSY
jgi:MraZ protein